MFFQGEVLERVEVLGRGGALKILYNFSNINKKNGACPPFDFDKALKALQVRPGINGQRWHLNAINQVFNRVYPVC